MRSVLSFSVRMCFAAWISVICGSWASANGKVPFKGGSSGESGKGVTGTSGQEHRSPSVEGLSFPKGTHEIILGDTRLTRPSESILAALSIDLDEDGDEDVVLLTTDEVEKVRVEVVHQAQASFGRSSTVVTQTIPCQQE